ncbi:hypothetical protein KEJ27_10135, partial [Candidatus Bathyarchaeota archaeon]|nr:hypothetical protein [Candidatus Bathyarchaeota archaeon]
IYIHSAGNIRLKPSKLAFYILLFLTFLNIPPTIYWITYILNPQLTPSYGTRSFKWLSEFDAMLLNICAPAYPLLILTTLYAWLSPSIGKFVRRHVRLSIKCNSALNFSVDRQQSNSIPTKRLSLTSILLLSIALPIIPYLPSINPSFKPVSVDIHYYRIWLEKMPATNPWSALDYAFYGWENGNRPLYLLLLYALTNLGIPKDTVLNFEALYIAPFFALSVYLLAKRLSEDHTYALLATLAGLLGFNMTVGMMAGFFAAWTALILFYACVALTPELEKRSLKSLGAYLTL